ncbi:DUF6750 family protein [Serratia sp. CY68758]|uniref:DUF6750 family protein n=1 Tax=Serratia TaxID=613 RepID=UPI00101F2104|nr:MULTISPECIES: DUF6750 family protein [Serratia]RZF11071.1 hypothetical protein B7L32_23295 [Serratia marcescens]TXE64892.1 hypothetical protein FOT59_25315 [Serratia nevei]WMC78397.1 hypothetical protein O8I25_27170 [Serratia nevei]WMC83827.1 hypothetical protein O8I24_27410 [Serratia nevei]
MNVLKSLKNAPLHAAVKIYMVADALRRHIASILAAVISMVVAPLAHADDDLAGSIEAMLNGVTSLKDPFVKSIGVIGLLCIAAGIIMMISKKNNPQIKVSHIMIAIVAGAALLALDQVANRSQKQMGMQPVTAG